MQLRGLPERNIVRLGPGDKIPNSSLAYFNSEDRLVDVQAHELFKDAKVVVVGVPGAFLPTCSMMHIPGFLDKAEALREKGIDKIFCISVNDSFVMDAWGKSMQADKDILMLADGNAEFAQGMGVDLDLTSKHLGYRSSRYSMVVNNLQIEIINLEDGGAFTISSAEHLLSQLGTE